MKEKHKNVFRKRFSFEKYGRGKERSKKETKFVNLFFEKKKKRKKKILPEKTKLFLSECKDYLKKKKKHVSKEDSKTLENVLRTWRDMVKKAGRDICQKQIREKRR